MRIYRVSYYGEPGDSSAQRGYSYHRTLKEARTKAHKAKQPYKLDGQSEIVRRSAMVDAIDITPTKDGIVSALNQYGGHPDNG